jgi:hypothetical protein
MKIDESKLSFMGSMNYIVQIMEHDEDSTQVQVDQYQPRRNKVHNFEISKEELRPQVEETMERMKIALNQMQEYLDGKRKSVYYWQLKDEKYDKD